MEETLKQVRAVREDLGWFDRSDMGKLAITGPDRYAWLQGMVSNDVRRLERGEVRRLSACILDPTGHVIAEVALIDVPSGSSFARSTANEGFILVETPPGQAEKIGSHLLKFLIMEDADVVNVSAGFQCTSIQGPKLDRIHPALDAVREGALVIEADHTGSGGIDVYNPGGSDVQYRANLTHFVSTVIGSSAQEILRIEAGIPKYGVDMDETTLAPEAGLMTTHISLTKGCYVGQEIVARIDTRGHTNRALTGLLVLGETLPAPGEKLYTDEVAGEGKETGRITSVAQSSLAAGGRPIALGYVRHEHRTPGTWLRLGSADSRRTVEVAELPFYRNSAS